VYTIDFDMMFNGFFAHDIAIGLQYKYANIKDYLKTELSLEEREKIFNQFIEGYCSVLKIDESISSQIDTFLRYRRAMRFIGIYRALQKDKDNFEVVREKVLKNEGILYNKTR
jgi:Ser/Thr protein kinase RdoA (MazF antagonist)